MNSHLRIRTPEGIVFSYPLAGPVIRSLAWAVDGVVILLMTAGLNRGLAPLGALLPDFAGALAVLGFFAVSVGYGISLEWAWRGQTLGKRLFKLRVTDAHGFRLQFYQVLLRNLVRPLDMIPACYMVGGLAALLTRRAQRLGDVAAGTVVVYLKAFEEPDLSGLLRGKFNSLRTHPHLAARLRQRVSTEQARLVLQALVRREELEPAARVELYGALAQEFQALVPFPAELMETMPDEQYLRNLTDILFGSATLKAGAPPQHT